MTAPDGPTPPGQPAAPRRTVPALARSSLNRAAHRRGDEEWLAQAWQRARVLVLADGRFLVASGRLVLLDPAQAAELAGDAERLFLGLDADEVPYFAVVAPLPTVEGAVVSGVREVGHTLGDLDAGLLMAAVALANWHTHHRYAPASGELTSVREGGWVRTDETGRQWWPRTDPAVIMLVHDGVDGPDGRCLLGHNAAWTHRGWTGKAVRRYSCLAGFVEPGESAEQTVVREVLEEVGLHVGNLRYVASQAWPYPGSLMLGFTAQGDPAEPLRLEPTEIADARWFTRREVRTSLAGEPDQDFALSPPSSIAHFLIETWAAE